MAQQQRTQVQGTIELLLKPEHDQNQNVVCLLVDLTLDANAVQGKASSHTKLLYFRIEFGGLWAISGAVMICLSGGS
jgi:hypothetical protein